MSTVADAISTASTINSSTSSSSSSSNLSVDTDTFLKLLVAQLSNQDPLNPQEDTEFITQLAQMTTLEEMQQIGSGMSSIQAYSLVGKYAYAEVTDSETGETNYFYGNIDSIVKNSGVYYAIIGDDAVKVDDIVQIFDSSLIEDDSSVDLTDLIGQTVTGSYEAEDGTTQTITGVVTGITYDQDDVYAIVDGIQISIADITAIGDQSDEDTSGAEEDAGAGDSTDGEQTTEV